MRRLVAIAIVTAAAGTARADVFDFSSWGVSTSTSKVVAGDFTGDGKDDVVAYNAADGQLTVRPSNAAGTAFGAGGVWATVSLTFGGTLPVDARSRLILSNALNR